MHSALPVRTLRRVAVAVLASVAAVTGFAHDTDSVEELTRAAERGDAESQFDLGFMYSSGFGDFEEDDAEALKWYQRAAEQGLAQAQSRLGTAYAYGHSLEQDFAQAATWCRLRAEQDDAGGQLCMAMLHAGGCGVEQDDTESARWYRLGIIYLVTQGYRKPTRAEGSFPRPVLSNEVPRGRAYDQQEGDADESESSIEQALGELRCV